jgi:hypothetical protein
VAEAPTEPPIPPAQQARRRSEDEILAELERRHAPVVTTPWKPVALERSTKWAGVQYVKVEPAYPPSYLGPLVVAVFDVELRGTRQGVEAVFQGLSIEAQPGEVRELSVARDPSDGMLQVKLRATLYARDPEMRGADEGRLEEAKKRVQTLTSGVKARGWLAAAAAGAIGDEPVLESIEQREGRVTYTFSARSDAAGEPLAERLAASPELAEAKFVGGMAEGKGKGKRSRLVIEARLK